MLRASIRSAVRKYNIENGLKILKNPNHHKMMRKELTMNIFPFENDERLFYGYKIGMQNEILIFFLKPKFSS